MASSLHYSLPHKSKAIDMGIGMKGQGIDKILAQFRQVDGSSTRRAEGSGLGLAITQHLIRNKN